MSEGAEMFCAGTCDVHLTGTASLTWVAMRLAEAAQPLGARRR